MGRGWLVGLKEGKGRWEELKTDWKDTGQSKGLEGVMGMHMTYLRSEALVTTR